MTSLEVTSLEALLDAFHLGLWVTFAVEFIRALPWPKEWLRRKPLACSVCLTGWVLITVSVTEFGLLGTPLFHPRYTPAGAFALLLLALLKHWRGLALEPPE